jgi:hypothetical protein
MHSIRKKRWTYGEVIFPKVYIYLFRLISYHTEAKAHSYSVATRSKSVGSLRRGGVPLRSRITHISTRFQMRRTRKLFFCTVFYRFYLASLDLYGCCKVFTSWHPLRRCRKCCKRLSLRLSPFLQPIPSWQMWAPVQVTPTSPFSQDFSGPFPVRLHFLGSIFLFHTTTRC